MARRLKATRAADVARLRRVGLLEKHVAFRALEQEHAVGELGFDMCGLLSE